MERFRLTREDTEKDRFFALFWFKSVVTSSQKSYCVTSSHKDS